LPPRAENRAWLSSDAVHASLPSALAAARGKQPLKTKRSKEEKRQLRQLASDSESFGDFEKAISKATPMLNAVAEGWDPSEWDGPPLGDEVAVPSVQCQLPSIGRRNGHCDPP
jgi:hypothetical protein